MTPWRSGISDSDAAHVWNRGYDVTDLMRGATFAAVVFLLHRGRLPNEGERRLMEAMLIASADHGAGSPSAVAARVAATGNRRGLEAAVAAGVLAIGDAHGGAGYAAMELIAAGVARAHESGATFAAVAAEMVQAEVASGRRIPGLGHRTHAEDPRTAVLFAMARDGGVAADGVAFWEAMAAAVAEQVRPLPINVDGALAAVLHDLGFPPQAAKLLFIVGRVGGLTAQVMEELAREQPMRVRVAVTYDGPAPRLYGDETDEAAED